MLVVPALTLPLPRLAMNKIGNRVGIENQFQSYCMVASCVRCRHTRKLVSWFPLYRRPRKKKVLTCISETICSSLVLSVKPHFSWDKTRIDFIVDEVWGRAEILPIGFYTTDGRKIFEIRGAIRWCGCSGNLLHGCGYADVCKQSCCMFSTSTTWQFQLDTRRNNADY